MSPSEIRKHCSPASLHLSLLWSKVVFPLLVEVTEVYKYPWKRMKCLGRTSLHLFMLNGCTKSKKKITEPNQINYLGVCIAVKAKASVFLLAEAGVAAQAVYLEGWLVTFKKF